MTQIERIYTDFSFLFISDNLSNPRHLRSIFLIVSYVAKFFLAGV